MSVFTARFFQVLFVLVLLKLLLCALCSIYFPPLSPPQLITLLIFSHTGEKYFCNTLPSISRLFANSLSHFQTGPICSSLSPGCPLSQAKILPDFYNLLFREGRSVKLATFPSSLPKLYLQKNKLYL